MSRSKHQRHGANRNGRHRSFDIMGYGRDYDPTLPFPTAIMFCSGHQYEWRHRKLKPYGRRNFCGWGEETYCRAYGEIMQPQVDKGAYRQQLKRELKKNLEEI